MKTTLIWISRILFIIACLSIAFGLGWLWNWWNSPLASHICYESGKELTAAITRELSYWWGWGIIGGVCLVVVSLPLYGIWVQLIKRKSN